jgi:hypothetical protein
MLMLLQVLIFENPKEHMTFCIGCEFLGENWVPKHITIGLFETFETLGQTLVRNVQDLIKLYG